MRRERKRSSSAGVVLLVASLSTLALPGSALAQKDVDRILAELRQIQAQLAQLQAAQNDLETTVNRLSTRSEEQGSTLRKSLADSQVTLEQMRSDVSVLSSRIDETNGRLGNIRREMSSLRQTQQPLILPPADPTGEGDEGEPIMVGEEAAGEESDEVAPIIAAVPSATDIYNQARTDYTQGRYPLAISGFKEVIETDVSGDLADNAHYWMGESFLSQNQYEQALEQFDVIIRDYPASNKRPDAYYKKAQTLEYMDRRSEARTMYELVIEQFPRTQVERLSRRKLEQLMRSQPPR